MALKYQGHVFDRGGVCGCCTTDARALSDPTQTGGLRKRLRSLMALRWRSLRLMVREVVTKSDVLGLKGSSLLNVAAPALIGGGTKIQLFQRWWDQAATTLVMGDGTIFRDPIDQAYDQGAHFATESLDRFVMTMAAGHHKEALLQYAVVELQGIMDAVAQKALRAAATGMLDRRNPMAVVRDMWAAIDKVGGPRTNALVETLITRAFSDGTLDVLEAGGVEQVGILPEAKRKTVLGDKVGGTGSKINRKTGVVSLRTVQRIAAEAKKAEAKLGKMVYVRTRGDDDVCPICEDIAEDGPYTINEARGLIPAHPHCRCAFIPAADKRFKRIRGEDAGPRPA